MLAALNDNLLENALAMLVVYKLAMENGPAIGALAGAALIVPFFLFSAVALAKECFNSHAAALHAISG